MSDKWEVVSGGKKKQKIGNGHVKPPSQPAVTVTTNVTLGKSNGKVKKSRKVIMDYKIQNKQGGGDQFEIPQPTAQTGSANSTSANNKPKKKPKVSNAPTSKKGSDLETLLDKVPVDELSNFFEELRLSGTANDAHLSWIKYSAGALNSRLNKIQASDVPQWPNELDFPTIPRPLQETIKTIISKTVASIKQDSSDVLGLSFSSLLATIPNLCQRADPGWGYLIFLREMILMDPDVMLRRARSYADIMESYENRKEIGIACLWVSAQACLHSTSVLRIVLNQILPFYNFKHYKSFVTSVLETLSVADMAGDIVIDTDEFEEFFEASFDPKKRRDFEKFYPRIKDLTLKSLSGRGSELFHNFLERLGEKDFTPLSVYGHETFDILHGCLENDPAVIPYWTEIVSKFPKESAALLNYLSKNVAHLNAKSHKLLESVFIQSDEFAVAAVKTPELLRAAKKLQLGFKRIEASRRRFTWKTGTFVLILALVGLLWLDTTENGKGSFSNSHVGKFLASYGVLDEVLLVGETTGKLAKTGYNYVAPLFRNLYEGVRPMLQTVEKQIEAYIPEVVQYISSISKQTVSYFNYLADKVFVGSLSPENLRKLTKDILAFVWTNIYYMSTKSFELLTLLVDYVKQYL